MKVKKRKQDVKVKWKDSRCILRTKSQWESRRINWIRVEYFHRIFVIRDSAGFRKKDHQT